MALLLSLLWSSTAVMAAPILDALKKGDQPRFRELLAAGADVNVKDKHGVTPLHIVAGRLRGVGTAEALLAAGAKVNVKDNRGRTPLHLLAARIAGSMCRSYLGNNFPRMQRILRNSSRRFSGRVMELEQAYPHVRCYLPFIGDVDLLRVTADQPTVSNIAAKELIHYLVHQAQDKTLFGRLAACKKDFGHSCLDLFGHIEENLRTATAGDLPQRTKGLKSFQRLLHKNLNKADLKYDREFCQQYLGEPKRCSSETP